MLLGQPIRQIAYAVRNLEEAARRHAKLFGSGPFFIVDDVSSGATYRGRETEFRHSAAFGQWGAVQVELIEPIGDALSIVTELFPEGAARTGLHHVAIIVESLDTAVTELAQAGYPEIFRATIPRTDLTAVFVDSAAELGHFIEVYERSPFLTDFYDLIERASRDFDVTNPLRRLTL